MDIDIKKWRVDHNVTQTELASMIGVSLVTIQTWERGIGKPNDENLKKLKEVIEGVG